MIFDVSSITGITADSRKVRDGYAFVALSGVKVDGRLYIADALAAGASYIIVEKGTPQQDVTSAEWVEVDNPRQFLAHTAAAFYKNQPNHIVTVTGTNGKTSTVNFARMIWSEIGKKSASLGTLGLMGEGLDAVAGMTTPDPVSLFSTLADLSDKKFTHLAMEASSHGLHQHRLDGVRVRAGGITNITRDHLDYHGTMDNYFDAKMRLFSDVIGDGGVAVINADIPQFSKIKECAVNRALDIITYGFSDGADLRIVERRAVSDGQDLTLNVFGKIYQVHLNLVGEFQAMNVLCAVGLVLSDKSIAINSVMSVLDKIGGVAGRLQPVPHSLKDIGVYIDYAHTPDGLETILNALRPHTTGRLICVFGCGGDRDAGKRPVMGEISTRLADITIVTDDNPRSEVPDAIRSEIMVGAKSAINISGRRNAIREAVKQLKAGDVLVVAGKGHEQGQIFADYTEPFDDLTETKSALQSLFQ